MTGPSLVITADDYGLTDATCRAILQAHHRGVVTATSALAVCPGIVDRLRLLDGAPDLAVGVHLAIVGEDPPLLCQPEIPSLVRHDGRFRSSWRVLLPALAAGRVDPDDVRREMAAQIEVIAEHVDLAHVDVHQHLHLWPSVGDVVVALACEWGIPRIRVPRSRRRGPRGRMIGVLADRLSEHARGAGRHTMDRFAGLDEAGQWTLPGLQEALRDLCGSGSSVELNVHPGASEDPDRERFDWGYRWDQERRALEDPALADTIRTLGYELRGS